MGKDNKRKKRYYRKQALNDRKSHSANKNLLQDHLKGFLVTCNQKEYQCLQECYNILNENLEKFSTVKTNIEEKKPDPNDINACIEEEIAEQLNHCRTFIQVKTKCKNLLFIKINDNDNKICPNEMLLSIWNDLELKPQQNSRYIQRIIPVIETCKAENILACFETTFEKNALKNACSYSVQCKVRNNSSFQEKKLQEEIIKIVRDKRPNWYVGLDRPDQLIQINIVCKAGCISLLKDYIRYSKYNIMEFLKKKKYSMELSKNVDEKNSKNVSG